MTIGNAKSFIKRGMADSELRKSLNRTTNRTQLNQILAEQHLKFSLAEFNDAYTNTLINCQFEEDANLLKEYKMWWDLLLMGLSDEHVLKKDVNDEENHDGKDF